MAVGSGDEDGSKIEQLLDLLSFRRVASVTKTRHPFTLPAPLSELCVVLDDVENLGFFAEIEILADSQQSIEPAKTRILEARRTTRIAGC